MTGAALSGSVGVCNTTTSLGTDNEEDETSELSLELLVEVETEKPEVCVRTDSEGGCKVERRI